MDKTINFILAKIPIHKIPEDNRDRHYYYISTRSSIELEKE